MYRQLKTYGDYFRDFYNSLDKDMQEKIEWLFEIVKAGTPISKEFF
jgi:hypothetical protein